MNRWNSHLPNITPFYAVKSNYAPHLLECLHKEGVRFDCASVREINAVYAIGASSEDIIYANPCKRIDDIVYAKNMSVNRTVVDSYEEVDKVVGQGWSGDSLLRIRVEDKNSVVPFGRKFGLNPSNVDEISKYALKKGLLLSGISFHVGSGCNDMSQYTKAIFTAASCLQRLQKNGHNANIIDIGGGFTTNTLCPSSYAIKSACRHIPKNIQVIAEPGRYFSEGSHSLFVQVIGKKAMSDGSPGYRYTIDESLYGQFSCIPFDCARPTWIRIKDNEMHMQERKRTPAIIFGRTCDSVDMIAMTEETEELMEGDWLLFPKMGAYTSVTSSEFNGFPKPPVYMLPNNTSMNEILSNVDVPMTAVIKYVTSVIVPENLPIYKSLIVV